MNKRILKNIGLMVITAVIAIGATYAYLNDTAKVSANTFSTGDADLKIKMPGEGCPDWSDSCAGKNWTALYPGWKDSYNVYLRNESPADIALQIIPFIEETGSNQDLWNKSYMEITWSDGSHSTGRYNLSTWKSNTAIGLVPILAKGQEAGPWVVKFDIDPSAGNEIANASISFNLVFDGVQEGESGASSVCGNSIVEGAETCDDGNTTNGDGCSSICQTEGVCTNGNAQSCYTGPAGTVGIGSCHAGSQLCQNNAWGACDGDLTPTTETCDSSDNNCNGDIDENLGGTACDGPDSDLCAEGISSCVAGVSVCSDDTGSTVDVCNGSDDDCDPASADGSEDPQNGAACDGPDTDFCMEGTKSCSGGGLTCSDSTGSNVEFCYDGIDNNCDGTTDLSCFACEAGLTNCIGNCVDTSSDNNNCGACGVVCLNGTHCSAWNCTY